MLFELFGYAVAWVCVLFLGCQSIFMLWFTLPKYNPIGGGKNNPWARLGAIVFFVVVVIIGVILLKGSPFHIEIIPNG